MRSEYIAALREAIQNTHGCDSTHADTVAVREAFNGQIVWDGEVEVFDLIDHASAAQCYAWGFQDDHGQWQYVAVLKTPPVSTALQAVQAYILSGK